MTFSTFDDENLPDVRRVRPYLGRSWRESASREQVATVPATRPFLLTSGRVASATDLAVETQVVSTVQGLMRQRTLPFERGDIIGVCTQPLAVAEVAARLRLHLSVVRVLVSDLSTDGDLAVYQAPTGTSQDIDLLLRVIRGLRAIS